MRRLFALLMLGSLFCSPAAFAQDYRPPGGSIATPVTVPNGGTNAASLTGHGALIMNAGGTQVTTVAPGASGRFFRSNGTDFTSNNITNGDLPLGVQQGAVAGVGVAGSLTISSNTTETTIRQFNVTSYTVNDAKTHTVLSGTVINCLFNVTIGSSSATTLTVANTLSAATGGASTVAGKAGKSIDFSMSNDSSSPPALNTVTLAGTGGSYTLGGGGGSGGSAWVTGANGGQSGGTGAGGAASGLGWGSLGAPVRPLKGIAGGGASGAGGSATSGGNGGQPTGKLTIVCGFDIAPAVNSVISVNGAAGANASNDGTLNGAGGGGGAGGGVLCLYALDAIGNSGTTSANGGAGGNGGAAASGSNGNGGGGGGGGGGGLVLWMSPNNIGAVGVASGGAGGTAGAKDGAGTIGTVGSTAGAGLVVSLTAYPNFPLIVLHQKWLEGAMGQLCYMTKARCGERVYEAGAHEHASMMASLECQQRHLDGLCFMQLNQELLTRTDPIGSAMPPQVARAFESDAKAAVACDQYLDEFTAQTINNPQGGLYCLADFIESDAG